MKKLLVQGYTSSIGEFTKIIICHCSRRDAFQKNSKIYYSREQWVV